MKGGGFLSIDHHRRTQLTSEHLANDSVSAS